MRWNSFVASPGSRLEGLMLGRLGPALWGDFVRHASLYREAYIAAFLRPVLSCDSPREARTASLALTIFETEPSFATPCSG